MAKKKPVMDRLARKAAAARAEGLSYGQWVAKHPEGLPPDPVEEEEKATQKAPHGTRVCLWCGQTYALPKKNDPRKYCSPECREAADSDRKKKYGKYSKKSEKEDQPSD
jgi:hypothetical protein